MSIKATFPAGVTELTVHGLHQWDYGQTLEIYADDLTENMEVHFACVGMKEAIVRECTIVEGSAQALIPDLCLEQSAPLTAWVYEIGENSGETVKTITMPIAERTKPQLHIVPPTEMGKAKLLQILESMGAQISRNEKRLTNSEQNRPPEASATDASVAYMREVPETALPYAEVLKVGGMTYRDGDTLKSAKATAIESVGMNLIPFPYELLPESGGTKFIINPDLSIDVSGKPSRSIYETMATLTLPAGTYYLHNYGDMSSHVRLYATDNSTYFANSSFTLTKESSVRIRIAVYDTFDGSTVRIVPLFKRGAAVPSAYTPYKKNLFSIPAEVQALDGYGESNPDNVEEYNYIDWSNQLFIACGHIVDGSWVAFDTVRETDISGILSADNYIEIEGGGTVTAVNEHGLAAPGELRYSLKTI